MDTRTPVVRTALSVGALAVAALGLSACAAKPSDYRDGDFSARGTYGSLPSHQDVTLTLDGGVVTDVSITTPAEDTTSLGYQTRFATALPGAIVGKKFADLSVDRLAGSSGCSEGFMDALEQIKSEASA